MEEESKVIKGYKGFDKDLRCLGFQYEIGKEYKCGKAVLCQEGFHFCENPIDVFGYYPPSFNARCARYCEVEGSGEFDKREDSNKICCTNIKIVRELTLQELIEECIKYNNKNVDREQVIITVDFESVANNKSHRSATINNGNSSVANNTGLSSVAKNNGVGSVASVLGPFSLAESTGKRSIAVTTKYASVARSLGNSSMAASFSGCSVAGTTSDNSVSVNIGNSSCAYNTGDFSLAVSTGLDSFASTEGVNSIALATGLRGKAKGALGTWIILVERFDWNEGAFLIKDIKAFKVDGEQIKPDTYYQLVDGKPVEAE